MNYGEIIDTYGYKRRERGGFHQIEFFKIPFLSFAPGHGCGLHTDNVLLFLQACLYCSSRLWNHAFLNTPLRQTYFYLTRPYVLLTCYESVAMEDTILVNLKKVTKRKDNPSQSALVVCQFGLKEGLLFKMAGF